MSASSEGVVSLSRTWLTAQGVRPETKAPSEVEVNAALVQLLRKPTKPDGPVAAALATDPLAALAAGVAEALEASAAPWGALRKRVPQLILRKPVGEPVRRAFESALDLAAEEHTRTSAAERALAVIAAQLAELVRQSKGEELAAQLAAVAEAQRGASAAAAQRAKLAEHAVAELGKRQQLASSALARGEEDSARALAAMRADLAKERRRNIQERFAMATVMERLLDLKRGLAQNSEGDRELRRTVELMQRQMAGEEDPGDEDAGEGADSTAADDPHKAALVSASWGLCRCASSPGFFAGLLPCGFPEWRLP
jgi:hypothetical protein